MIQKIGEKSYVGRKLAVLSEKFQFCLNFAFAYPLGVDHLNTMPTARDHTVSA